MDHEDMDHEDGDGCAVYLPEYELSVIGYRNTVAVDDVEAGDFVHDPAADADGVWFEVLDSWTAEDDGVHLSLEQASADEVAQARRDACEGHETTRGAIGDTYYCDGSCV